MRVAITSTMRETLSGLPRQFWWLWTSTLVNRLGGFVATFLALYLTAERGYSPSYAGLVAALYGLGGAGGAVLGGVLADRIGRRITLLTAQVGAAAATAVLGLVTAPLAVAAVAALLGLVGNASRPALSAMIADLVPPEDRVRAFSLNYWAINIGFGVSAAVAGFVAAEGYLWLFLGDAVTTLLCALVVFAKVRETLPNAEPHPNATAHAESGAASGHRSARGAAARNRKGDPRTAPAARPITLADVARDRRFMAVAGLTFLVAAVMQQGSSTLAVDMGADGYSARQYGLVIALNGLVIVLIQIPLTRALRSRSAAGLLATGSLLMAWGFGATAFAGSVAVYALTVVIWTVGEIVHAPASMSVVADLAPASARGRYQGMFSLAWSGAAFAGPLAGGVTLDHLGRGAVWWGCAAVGTVAGAGYYGLLRTRTSPLLAEVPAPEVPVPEVPVPAGQPAAQTSPAARTLPAQPQPPAPAPAGNDLDPV